MMWTTGPRPSAARFAVREAYFYLIEPTKEFGMHDHRLDEREQPERHPDAVKRLTKPPRRTVSSTGGELPGRKMDGRR
jgi:hypothetical protein